VERCIIVGSRLAVVAALLAVVAGRATPHTTPPRPAGAAVGGYDTSYGNGHFGHWTTDRFGLPAFVYTADETRDSAARWSDNAGVTHTTFWHQVGNDRIVADAYNDGYTQLWDQERQDRFSNQYDASTRHYAGGYGYLDDGRQAWSTLYLDRPVGAAYRRVFGVGYYETEERANGIAARHTVFAPFGDDPALRSEVTLTNTGRSTRRLRYVAYWDVNPLVVPAGFGSHGASVPQPPAATRYDAAGRTLVATPAQGVTPTPHALFLAALTDPVAGYETSVARFFGRGARARPDEVVQGRLSDTVLHDARSGAGVLFALQADVTLAPGASHTLEYAYGYGDTGGIAPLVRRLATRPYGALARSEAAWRATVPTLRLPQDPWLARETVWNAYYLRSSAIYEDAWHTHLISQGYEYQYEWGLNIAYRDPLQHLLPLIYLAPALARDTLRFGARAQPRAGDIPYGFVGGQRFDPNNRGGGRARSDDLDLWLLWAGTEYVLATRDFAFLRQREPYYGGGTGTLYDHLKEAYRHQIAGIGVGPHGDYRMLAGDWSDGEGDTGATESTQTTAQAAWVFPFFAQLADAAGDHAFAAGVRAEGAALRRVVAGQWTGHWFNRGYKGNAPYGVDALYLNAQPWALLSGAATPARAVTDATNVRDLLSRPSPIGAASESRSQGYGRAREEGNGTAGTGGVWYALNGLAVWAFGAVDPALAYREYRDNTHAAYAQAYPDNWFGVLSGPDSYNSFESPRAGQAALMDYPVQDAHAHAWQLYDTYKEAGIQPTGDGYTIDPHWPFRDFAWDGGIVGVRYAGRAVSGYLRPEGSDTVTMRVRLPVGVSHAVSVRVDGRLTSARVGDGFVTWRMRILAGRRAAWTVRP